jgi:hypothetical protein
MESNLPNKITAKCLNPHATSTDLDRDAEFLAMLPRIRQQAAYHLRRLPTEKQAEAVEEVVANTFVSYVHLIERGKANLAFAGPLARYAVCQYLDGRRVGSSMNCNDVTSDYCRQKKGFSLVQLDHIDESTGEWKELIVEDRRSTPAEVATTRIDFGAWLESLPERTKRVAETLATGEATSHAARMFGCSASRISQLRGELYQAWRVFQGEVPPVTSSAVA